MYRIKGYDGGDELRVDVMVDAGSLCEVCDKLSDLLSIIVTDNFRLVEIKMEKEDE